MTSIWVFLSSAFAATSDILSKRTESSLMVSTISGKKRVQGLKMEEVECFSFPCLYQWMAWDIKTHDFRVKPGQHVLHHCCRIKYQREFCMWEDVGDLAEPFGEFHDHLLVSSIEPGDTTLSMLFSSS